MVADLADPVVKVAKIARLKEHLRERVIGQTMAIDMVAEALTAGEMGHTLPGRPRSFVLILGPTGTGKTKVALESSKYLYGSSAIARINVAEFSTEERVPMLLGTKGDRGLIGHQLDELRDKGGKIILLDEIEKGHKKVSDMFLGMEAAEITLGNNEKIDLSENHIWVTSNLASGDLSELDENTPKSTVKRVVEMACGEHFRPEVFARFTHVVVYNKLTQAAQLSICTQMLTEEVQAQSEILTREFGHPHQILIGDGVYRRLVSEGYHRNLGARPMRNAVERRVRNAICAARCRGSIVPGITTSQLILRADEIVLLPVRRGLML